MHKDSIKCVRCKTEISKPGLCYNCMKSHDRIVKLACFVLFVLAIISMYKYYQIFIAS